MSLGLELQPERAFLRRRSSIAIPELPGFVRGRHRLPSEHGRGAEMFVHDLADAALADEVRAVYDGAKQVLGLRRRELERAIASGGGNVETPQFSFAIELGVDPADIGRALWQRRVVLLMAPRSLPADFDRVFPVACDELVVPLVLPAPDGAFDFVVDRLEDFAEDHGGDVEEDEDQARACLRTRDGSLLNLDLVASELSVRVLGFSGCCELLGEVHRRFDELAGPIVAALEAGRGRASGA